MLTSEMVNKGKRAMLEIVTFVAVVVWIWVFFNVLQ